MLKVKNKNRVRRLDPEDMLDDQCLDPEDMIALF